MYTQNSYFPVNNYRPNINQGFMSMPNKGDDRFVGGFAFPFLLGGVTGAAIAPAFFGGYNNNIPPYYYNNYYYPPYYQPYYRYY